MIAFPGYESVIRRVYESKQEHVFEYWNDLNDSEKKNLLDDLSDVDFSLLLNLFFSAEDAAEMHFDAAPYIALPKSSDEKKEYEKAREAGDLHVRQGKVAAFVVAGGQGSRLGYDGPKGMFPVGPVSGKTLFHIHAEKIAAYSQKYGVHIPFLIMTSRSNHPVTVDYFNKNDFFGLGRDNVFIFPQNMIPSLDAQGKLILESKKSIFKNPDGHGGSLTALHTSGVLERLKERGVETISYFQVDNPLVRIIDSAFIGFHVLRGADVSSKAVKKAYPEEKVGIFVRYGNNTIGVVEYSDMPEEKTHSLDEKGDLRFSSGSIAIHLFQREFVERVAAGTDIALPFHTARKKIKALVGGVRKEVEGFKFEKFVFDALPLTEKNIVFETLRQDEFAPVKNSSGVDSVESAQSMMSEQHRRWLRNRGIRVPGTTRVIEISPLVAVEQEDLDADIKVPEEEQVYIDSNR